MNKNSKYDRFVIIPQIIIRVAKANNPKIEDGILSLDIFFRFYLKKILKYPFFFSFFTLIVQKLSLHTRKCKFRPRKCETGKIEYTFFPPMKSPNSINDSDINFFIANNKERILSPKLFYMHRRYNTA